MSRYFLPRVKLRVDKETGLQNYEPRVLNSETRKTSKIEITVLLCWEHTFCSFLFLSFSCISPWPVFWTLLQPFIVPQNRFCVAVLMIVTIVFNCTNYETCFLNTETRKMSKIETTVLWYGEHTFWSFFLCLSFSFDLTILQSLAMGHFLDTFTANNSTTKEIL